MKKTCLVVLIISLTLASLLIALEHESFKLRNYTKNYLENNIVGKTGKDLESLEKISLGLIEYIKNDAGNEVLRPHFNEREILHMEDVQVLFKYGSIIKSISILLSLIIMGIFLMKKQGQVLGECLFKGMFVNWIVIALLLLMIVFNFNKYFTYFHLIFFTNDLWLLDPRTDLMIQMLPETFFINMAKKIGLLFAFYIAILQGLGYAISRMKRKNIKSS